MYAVSRPQAARTDQQGRWLCQAPGCERVATLGWSKVDGELYGDAVDADRVEVSGCDAHAIDEDDAARMHLSSCQAPPACTCLSVGYPSAQNSG